MSALVTGETQHNKMQWKINYLMIYGDLKQFLFVLFIFVCSCCLFHCSFLSWHLAICIFCLLVFLLIHKSGFASVISSFRLSHTYSICQNTLIDLFLKKCSECNKLLYKSYYSLLLIDWSVWCYACCSLSVVEDISVFTELSFGSYWTHAVQQQRHVFTVVL